MALLFKKKNLSAGLSLEGGAFRLLTLSDGEGYGSVLKSACGRFPKEILRSDDICENFDAVFKFVAEESGGISTPVNLGLPVTESLLRVVDMPGLSLAEAKQAFKFEVENYFPFSESDCAYDLAEIDYPVGENVSEKRFLVAAARKALLENITRAAASHGIRLASLEPSQIALERAAGAEYGFDDACVYIYAGVGRSVVILSWKGCGIFYGNIASGFGKMMERGANDDEYAAMAASFSREVRSSLQFAMSRSRAFTVKTAYLFGFGASRQLSDMLADLTSLENVTLIDVMKLHGICFEADGGGWETALGLALR